MTQQFSITVVRLATVHQSITVIAETPEIAAQRALKSAKSLGAAGWEVNDVYNDGKAHCELSVSLCVDEEGEEHSVEASVTA